MIRPKLQSLVRCLFAAVLAFALTGCMTSSSSRLNYLSVGMTKADVLQVMGDPDSVAAKDGAEYLSYTLRTETSLTRNTWGYQSFYFVRLMNGKVDSYGRIGDFDSTKDPTVNLNIKNR